MPMQQQSKPYAESRSVAQSPAHWQQAMAQAVTDPAELLDLLALPQTLLPGAERARKLFRLRVPRSYIARMQPGEPDDPLLRQVLPLDAEFNQPAGFSSDAVGDLDARAETGLLHKYHGRALLVTTGACAVNCRYCFRRHFPYAEENAARGRWGAALEAIRADDSLEEIILSGGDPLSLTDAKLAQLVTELEAIDHVKRLRIHSRQPIVLPERVDDRLLDWLAKTRLQTVIVVHANHPHELDTATTSALQRLRQTGATLLNQSVLLQGVNDNTEALVQLSEQLFAASVLPYYLHLLDRVQGVAHFEVPEQRARTIWHDAAKQLPGFLLPRLAREEAGQGSKTMLGMDHH